MENIIDHQKMLSLQALANTNMMVSEAKGLLVKLQETETEYLVGREKKAMGRIQKVHDDSAELLAETQKNYAALNSLLATVASCSEYLGVAYGQFHALLADFEERNALWEKGCAKWEAKVAETRNLLKVEQTKIENVKKANARAVVLIEQDRRRVEDLRETAKRTIERLKNNRL